MDRSFLDANVTEIVGKLKADERALLLAGVNWWNTLAIPRLNVPGVRMSDGPNGVRGSSHFQATPAQCLPCATSLAATFDPDMIYEAGEFLAEETKIKSSVILLAPTCNIQRNPLGGRAFESFSEDPHLSGTMAAAYVNGLQSRGVAATIKHFVGNDQEDERTAADSVVSMRALREIYLYPFMLAQKLAKPWAFMTSYGRLDNVHVSENPAILQDILRNEWGLPEDAIIMSDWYGTYGTAEAIVAGLDLEMPGPPRWRTPILVYHSLSCQKVLPSHLNARAETMLRFVQKMARTSPDVVYGDGIERSRDSPELRAFARRVAGAGIVLLKNERKALPLGTEAKTILVVGPNAKARVYSGGGSAQLKPTYVVSPFEGIVAAAPEGVEVKYALGCYAHKYLPQLEENMRTADGEKGWVVTFFSHDENGEKDKDLGSYVLDDTRVKVSDFAPKGITPTWSLEIKGKLTIESSGEFELGVAVAGRAKLFVDGKLTIDNWTKQRPGDFFYGQGTVEEKAVVNVEAGKPLDVLIEYTNTPPPDSEQTDTSQPGLMLGVRLGGAMKIDAQQALEDAVKLAARADAVVVIAGLTPEWEAEGFDRASLKLPGLQDELISKIAKVNDRTVVAVQCGSATSMPWVHDVAAVVQSWYQGNEAGNALADVLFGKVNPSGKLPVSFPVTEADIPSWPNVRSENGKIHYREDLFVGYKGYQMKGVAPLFPFGHGLSYTTFAISDLKISEPIVTDNDLSLEVSATVKNTGSVSGSEVVQVYVSLPNVRVTTPKLQLRGFAKVRDLAPGEARMATVKLERLACAFWEERSGRWEARKGTYGVYVGSSSYELPLEGEFELKRTLSWNGV
ncbi:glycoside hydrolase family 3 protein [Peniophora sp. CONT]|nr:glycoside hydrolase family 3 protein [Peniophora sp. CONT]